MVQAEEGEKCKSVSTYPDFKHSAFKRTIDSLMANGGWVEVPRVSLLTYRVLPIVFTTKYL